MKIITAVKNFIINWKYSCSAYKTSRKLLPDENYCADNLNHIFDTDISYGKNYECKLDHRKVKFLQFLGKQNVLENFQIRNGANFESHFRTFKVKPNQIKRSSCNKQLVPFIGKYSSLFDLTMTFNQHQFLTYLEYGKTNLHPSIRISTLNVVLNENFDPKVKYTGLFVFAIKQNDFWYNGIKVLVSTEQSEKFKTNQC